MAVRISKGLYGEKKPCHPVLLHYFSLKTLLNLQNISNCLKISLLRFIFYGLKFTLMVYLLRLVRPGHRLDLVCSL